MDEILRDMDARNTRVNQRPGGGSELTKLRFDRRIGSWNKMVKGWPNQWLTKLNIFARCPQATDDQKKNNQR